MSDDFNVDNVEFAVVPFVKTPNVGPGDRVKVGLFLTGYGVPDKSKLHINFSSIEMNEDSEIIVTKNIVKSTSGDKLAVSTRKKDSQEFNLDSSSGKSLVTGVGPELFLHKPVDDHGEYDYPPVHGELGVPEAPLEIEFELADSVRPGNYSLDFAVTYGDEDKVEGVTSRKLDLHVENWYERNIDRIKPFSIALGILTVLLASLSFAVNILDFLIGINVIS